MTRHAKLIRSSDFTTCLEKLGLIFWREIVYQLPKWFKSSVWSAKRNGGDSVAVVEVLSVVVQISFAILLSRQQVLLRLKHTLFFNVVVHILYGNVVGHTLNNLIFETREKIENLTQTGFAVLHFECVQNVACDVGFLPCNFPLFFFSNAQ
jgi:hypothetical protein